MSEDESEEVMEVEAETEAEAPPAAEDEQDKVKPVVFIGLFITALLCIGKDEMKSVITNSPYSYSSRNIRCVP